MKSPLMTVMLAAGVVGFSASHDGPVTSDPVLERMPAALEARFALSALPPGMREHATVYLLDPAKGYRLARQGTSGVACLVQRTGWESSDYRSDIYVPRCYDAEGARTFLGVLMDAATLRAGGMTPAALKTEIERRYRSGSYTIPAKAGLSYMLGPIMRTWDDDGKVRTMSGPHVMFYAPNVTNKDIGAVPESPAIHPFVVQEGVPEQSYIVQLVGKGERSKIMADEQDLLTALCAYRASLCLRPAHSSS